MTKDTQTDLQALTAQAYEVDALIRMAMTAARDISMNSDAEQSILIQTGDIATALEVALVRIDAMHHFIESAAMAADGEKQEEPA